jgi:transposase-like protein
MYTTNIIEGFHRQLRKVTKTKSVFQSYQSLEKMLYLASQNAYKEMDSALPKLVPKY